MVIATGTSSANAGRYDRLEDAADRYREAVSDFEDRAEDVRTVDRHTLRWIDRLEDAASDLRSATRRPEHSQRLLTRFAEVESLQVQVESAVFGIRCPLVESHLRPCWQVVLLRFDQLSAEVGRFRATCFGAAPQIHPRHHSSRHPGHFDRHRGGDPFGSFSRNFPGGSVQRDFSRGFGSPFPPTIPFSSSSIRSSRSPFDAGPPISPRQSFGAALIGSLLQRAMD